MSKKIITIIIAAAMIASSAINAFAVGNTSNNSFNVSAQTYTTMSATDKEKFINDNLDVKLQHMSSLVTLTANGDYDKIAEEVKNALDSGLTATENQYTTAVHIADLHERQKRWTQPIPH